MKRLRASRKALRLTAASLKCTLGSQASRTGNMSVSEFKSMVNENCVLDTNLKFAFFAHNKNAQTSVNRELIADRVVVRKDSEFLWQRAAAVYIRNWDHLKPVTFTIVRNPYERTISAFRYLQHKATIEQDMDFRSFILSILKNVGPSFDPHLHPQARYYRPIAEIEFDKVIHFEQLSQGWKELAIRIDAPTMLPRANATNSPNASAFDSYDQETADVVFNVYRDDFDQLGYNREVPK